MSPNDQARAIIATLREARARQGMSQRAVSMAMGSKGKKAGNQVCMWEQIDCSPTIVNLIKWAEAVGCKIEVRPR